MVMLCFPKMRLMVVMLTWFMLLNTCLSASIFCSSWWRRMALSALTRSTTASSCCCVNRRWRPPPEGLLVILEKYNHKLSSVCFFFLQYFTVYTVSSTVLKHLNISNHGMFHKNYHFGCKRSISTLQYPVVLHDVVM